MERNQEQPPRKRQKTVAIAGAAGLALAGALAWVTGDQNASRGDYGYGLHQDINTTVFWVGEEADASNRFIHNRSSTWMEDWAGAYGGVDAPTTRCGLLPCGFKPKENPFYFALPYNDLDDSCRAKPSQRQIPWVTEPPPTGRSAVKNQWIEIRFAGKVAYAQWEDAGPFGEDDADYVFGESGPKETAGLDISPATAAYLGLKGRGKTEWQFIPEQSVPNGPWSETITRSLPDCARQTR